MTQPRPFSEWHEDHGNVLWFFSPISEAPYCGSPLDCGRTMSIEIQIGFEQIELPTRDVGGWPWSEEDEPQLWWTPLPDCNAIQKSIDAVEAGNAPPADMGAIAIGMVVASLSPAQIQLLKDLRPNGDGWTYPVKVRGDGLQSCMALAKRGIVSGDNPRPFQNRGRGFIRLTPFGEGLRNIIVGRVANG